MSDFSENVDDPYSSGDNGKEDDEKKKNKRRLSSRLSKRPRVSLMDNPGSTDEDSEEELKLRTVVNRKPKIVQKKIQIVPVTPVKVSEPVIIKTDYNNPMEFTSGNFVINKADAQGYEASNPPHIWRIDGKALLQKFEPFESDGILKYRNTSIYTGWSSLETDKYAPLKVDVQLNSTQQFLLTFDPKQLKEIVYDSD